MSRKIGYARVSSRSQSNAMQIAELERAGCTSIFSDHAVSGTATQRSGLDEALAQARAGDVIVVWKLDRLARSLSFLVKLIDEFSDKEIGLISITDGINTTTHAGKLIIHLIGAIADFERNIIIERSMLGLENARRAGKRLGRPPKLSPDCIAKAHFQMTKQGKDIAHLATEMNVSTLTLKRGFEKFDLPLPTSK